MCIQPQEFTLRCERIERGGDYGWEVELRDSRGIRLTIPTAYPEEFTPGKLYRVRIDQHEVKAEDEAP